MKYATCAQLCEFPVCSNVCLSIWACQDSNTLLCGFRAQLVLQTSQTDSHGSVMGTSLLPLAHDIPTSFYGENARTRVLLSTKLQLGELPGGGVSGAKGILLLNITRNCQIPLPRNAPALYLPWCGGRGRWWTFPYVTNP